MTPILYTREEVLTLVRSHLIKVTAGNLTSREHEIVGEVASALPMPRKNINDLGARVGKSYPKVNA